MTKPTTRLRRLLEQEALLIAPGAYDSLVAKLIRAAGFAAVYMTGGGVSYTTLGSPDIGLLTMSEMAERAAHIAAAVPELPVIADGDNGYGGPFNVMRTVQAYERAGVACVQLEDQVTPKRCGHMAGKEVIPAEEMARKIEAAVHARRDPDFCIMARTDARSVHGMDDALGRARLYADAGADIIFLEAPQSVDEMRQAARVSGKPTLANMVEGGKTPILPASELQELGYKIAIYPNFVTRATARYVLELLQGLKAHGTSQPFWGQMFDWTELNNLLGLQEVRALEQRFKP